MTIDKLIAKLETASGPCCSLDHEIDDYAVSIGIADGHGAPLYTRSIDAALALVPGGWGWAIDHPSIQLARRITNGAVVLAEVYDGKGLVVADRAPIPALALCIAALKAKCTPPPSQES